MPGRYQDLPPAAPAAASFPLADSGSCSIQMQEGAFSDIQQQFVNDRMPSCSGGGGVEGGYSGSLSPPAALPAPWCHGLSSDEDYYGPGTVRLPQFFSFDNNHILGGVFNQSELLRLLYCK